MIERLTVRASLSCRVRKSFTCGALGLAGLLATAAHAQTYAKMAPAGAYMMERADEIALARSAAPPSISKDATILVLTHAGYQVAATGTNGFVCYVGRGFGGAPDWPERWNPHIKAAACDNPPAARSFTPLMKLRTAMTLAGKSDAEIMNRIKAVLRTGEVPPLEQGSMCYMMSKLSYLSEAGGHNMAHVMFYVPFRNGDQWGANLPGSPVIGGGYWFLTPGNDAEAATLPPISVLLVGTSTFSDGSPAVMRTM